MAPFRQKFGDFGLGIANTHSILESSSNNFNVESPMEDSTIEFFEIGFENFSQ